MWGHVSFGFFFFFSFFNTASKARRPYQFSGKITVKAKEKSYSKLEIPYQAEVLEGWVILWLYVESGWFLYNTEDKYFYQSFFCFFSFFVICSGSYLGFDHTATLFHIRDSPVDPVDRPIFLTNAFSFAIRIHNVSLPEEAKTMFKVECRHKALTKVALIVLWDCHNISFLSFYRCRTSAYPSLFPHTNPVTSSPSSSGQFDPPFT